MWVRSCILGVGCTVILLVVLVMSRVMRIEPTEDKIKLHEIESNVVEIPAPEPPANEVVEQEIPTEVAQQQAPDLPQINVETPSVEQLTVIKASPTMTLQPSSIEAFSSDLPVAPLAENIRPKPVSNSKPSVGNGAKVKKAYHNISDLDAQPRELRQGVFRWPRRAKGSSGWVKCVIQIDKKGRVSVVKVLEHSDSALIEATRKVATGGRFTVPKVNGKPVKARYIYTYKLKRPRR